MANRRRKRTVSRRLIAIITIAVIIVIAFSFSAGNKGKIGGFLSGLFGGSSNSSGGTDSGGGTGGGTASGGGTQYASEKDFEYEWDKNVKDGIIINKYVGTQKEVRIPPTIQKFKVTSIDSGAFRDNKNITSVTIPNNVTSIGARAFINCSSLTSVTIPRSVTKIGVDAFKDCTNLTSVTFQGVIARKDFGAVGQVVVGLFPGDLADKYLDTNGGAGTYTRFANSQEWRKR
jgi:hypothetical protein